jgi:hypothetical protein
MVVVIMAACYLICHLPIIIIIIYLLSPIIYLSTIYLLSIYLSVYHLIVFEQEEENETLA